MTTIKYIGNGSSGNATFYSDGTTSIYIDNGLPLKKTTDKVDYILVSHSHSDHISGISRYAKKYGIRAIVDRSFILHETGKIDEEYLQYEDFLENFYLNSILVEPFGVWHDQPCFGFMLNNEYIHLTDTGKIPFTLIRRIKKHPIKALYIESNYDDDLIDTCDYDEFLKARIKSRLGHLSNQEVMSFLAKNANELEKVEKIILGHLSENTNTPEMLERRIKELVPESISKKIFLGNEISIV